MAIYHLQINVLYPYLFFTGEKKVISNWLIRKKKKRRDFRTGYFPLRETKINQGAGALETFLAETVVMSCATSLRDYVTSTEVKSVMTFGPRVTTVLGIEHKVS